MPSKLGGTASPCPDGTVHLRGGGVSLLLDAAGPGLPRVVHWGGDLGSDVGGVLEAATAPLARATFDVRLPLSLVPKYRGRPGLTGDRPATFVVEAVDASDDAVRVSAHGDGLALESVLALDRSGVLRMQHRLRNEGTVPYTLAELGCVLPVPVVAAEVLDLTGRWCRERHPQRRRSTTARGCARRATAAPASTRTLLLVAGTPGFGFRARRGVGRAPRLERQPPRRYAERHAGRGVDARRRRAARARRGRAAARARTYATPWLYAAWSDARPRRPRAPRCTAGCAPARATRRGRGRSC